MAELQATLDELDGLLRTTHPGLHERLRPGLAAHDVDELAAGLQPYHLPADQDRGQLHRLAQDMAHLGEVPPVQYVAVRIVPL